MKNLKLSLLIAISLAFIATIPANTVHAKEIFTKTISKKATVNEDALLDIYNKFGDVEMTAYDGNEVVIEIKVGLDARNQDKADKLLKEIELDYNASSGRVTAHIDIKGGNYQNLDIDWKVKFPKNNNLKVKVMYGDLELNEANAATDIKVSYGKMILGHLRSKDNKLALMYGSGSLESAGYLDFKLRYSEINHIGKAKLLNLDAMYSEANLISIGRLNLESAFDDFEIAAVAELNAETDYTDLEVEAITMKLDIDMDFGDLEVEKISKGFDLVNVRSTYSDSELAFERGASIVLDAKASYGDIKISSGEWEKTVQITSESVSGSNGEGGGNPVTLRSSFGDIKIDLD